MKQLGYLGLVAGFGLLLFVWVWGWGKTVDSRWLAWFLDVTRRPKQGDGGAS
jgi:hypothetical protein